MFYHGERIADLSGTPYKNLKAGHLDVLLSVPFPDEALPGACVIQDEYLKIEKLLEYSPVDPEPGGAYSYRRDCFRRPGHEDGTISD